ncbi:MAG: polysaccharide biosynthesis C-terminal domain-containing protein [Ignavibacteriales bacterium]|nr:polysaccharide biosynthesis C-terminal domain-containing protein [Ignavibacteriales bacterium]
MIKKITSTITGTSIFISILLISSRGIGIVREIIYAKQFGLTQQFDIFLVATVIPGIINNIFFYFAQNYFIPIYHKIPSDNNKIQNIFLRKSFWIFISFGIILLIILFLLRDIILENYLWNAGSDIKNTSTEIFLIFSITIPICAAYSILSAYLQAKLDFANPAIAQLLLNILIILSVLFLSNVYGIYAIPIGYIAGYSIQLIYIYLHSKLKFNIKLFRFDFLKKLNLPIKEAFIFILLIEIISSLHLLVDRYFVNYIDTGGISALNYSTNLFQTPISIFSYAISISIFPFISQQFNKLQFDELGNMFKKALKAIIIIFVGLTFIYLFWGDTIIKILFLRGAFTYKDTIATYNILKMHSIGIVFFAAYGIINRVIYSIDLRKQLFIITSLVLIIKIILNFLFVAELKQDGLALSTSISMIVLFITSFYFVIKKIKLKNISELIGYTFIIILNSLLTIILIYLFMILIKLNSEYDIYGLILFPIIFILNSRFIKIEEISIISKALLKIIKK